MLNKKLLLASVRAGDFTHPGEIQAIELVLSRISCNKMNQVLDVGCGLGGTANYFNKNNCGIITGVDIDPNAISYARSHYPDIDFLEGDVLTISNLFSTKRFDLIYLFSSFYAFRDHKKALEELNKIAKPGCQLVIFDYATDKNYKGENPFNDDGRNLFYPIDINKLKAILNDTGWVFSENINLTENFRNWYVTLLDKMNKNKADLIKEFGVEAFDINFERFSKFLNYIELEKLGGELVLAVKK